MQFEPDMDIFYEPMKDHDCVVVYMSPKEYAENAYSNVFSNLLFTTK